jgi:hypothetical protein
MRQRLKFQDDLVEFVQEEQTGGEGKKPKIDEYVGMCERSMACDATMKMDNPRCMKNLGKKREHSFVEGIETRRPKIYIYQSKANMDRCINDTASRRDDASRDNSDGERFFRVVWMSVKDLISNNGSQSQNFGRKPLTKGQNFSSKVSLK